jgi:gamma-glutamylcyclotransferase (GGCT)/AIG2-like uncharacterized protein YtfP
MIPAKLDGYKMLRLPNMKYPVAIKEPSSSIPGTLLVNLNLEDLKRIEEWEETPEGIGKEIEVIVETEEGKKEAFVYVKQKIKLNNWQGWTIIWLALFIGPSISVWYWSVDIYVITLISIILLIIYEVVFIRLYLGKKNTGLRALLEEKIKGYTPKEKHYDKILRKIGTSVTVLSALTSATISLIVFPVGFLFLYLANDGNFEIGLNSVSFIIFGMLTSLIIAAICYLISLDQYDTAADPSFDVKTKWKMRQLALEYFVFGWYFLIFGIFIELSLIHPLSTLIGCCCYVSIHNRFWFQTL